MRCDIPDLANVCWTLRSVISQHELGEESPLREKAEMSATIRLGVKRTDRTAVLQPGEVITARIYNGIENLHASGKVRLVVVVKATDSGGLTVIGLTSKGMTQSGEWRVEMYGNGEWGWRGRSFVFGKRLTKLSRIDVLNHVGWISVEDGETLAREFDLDPHWMTSGEKAVA